MAITRAKAVTAATLAALSGLTAVALASNSADPVAQSQPAPALTTPIVEHRTEVVRKTIHRTKTVDEQGHTIKSTSSSSTSKSGGGSGSSSGGSSEQDINSKPSENR